MMNYRPQPGVNAQVSNAQMAARILEMPFQPYQEGGFVYRVAEIRGRISGNLIQVPIAVTMVNGELYLISPKSDRPWAQNLLKAGECDLVSAAGREHYRSEPASGDEAVGAVRTYLNLLGWAKDQFPFTADDPEATILARLHQVAIFRLVPASSTDASPKAF